MIKLYIVDHTTRLAHHTIDILFTPYVVHHTIDLVSHQQGTIMHSPWPEGSERSDGCAWALVLVGETVTKECHPGQACRCDCPAHTHNSNVSSNTWCTRKNLCVPRNWEFRHATRILDVIMLKYPLKMRPMPGMWVQSVPVTAIPWGGMNTEQRNTLQRSVRQDD